MHSHVTKAFCSRQLRPLGRIHRRRVRRFLLGPEEAAPRLRSRRGRGQQRRSRGRPQARRQSGQGPSQQATEGRQVRPRLGPTVRGKEPEGLRGRQGRTRRWQSVRDALPTGPQRHAEESAGHDQEALPRGDRHPPRQERGGRPIVGVLVAREHEKHGCQHGRQQ